MTNQQGAPEAPSYEHQRAIMEGERNASLDAYSRVLYLTQTESRIYEAGFTNGWNRLAALVEAQQPSPSAAETECVHEWDGLARTSMPPKYACKHCHNFFDAPPSPTPQPAPSAAVEVGEAPLPLLVRDIAADLGTTPIQVCIALAQLGFGGHSVNMAVTPRMAKSLRAHFASPTPQADSAPGDPDGEAFRTAARLGLTLRFYGGCAQSSMPGTPSAYEVVTGQDRATAMREAVGRAEAVIAAGGKPLLAPLLAPQADSQPAPVRDERDDFEKAFPLPSGCIRCGTGYASTGYSNWAAHTHVERWEGWQARAARAPADSVTAPAGCNNIPGMAEKALAKLKSHIDHVAHKDGHWETRHLKDALFDLEWIVRRKLTPTQAADSVLEDAARWNEVLMHVGADNLLGGAQYVLRGIKVPVNVLQGSVAQHFTKSIDAARKQGGGT